MERERAALAAGLHRLDRALRVATLRQVTEAEDQLQREWEVALTPILTDLYWEPLYRLNDAPDDEDDLHEWLLLLLMASAARRRLVENLGAYLRWSADVGGRMALTLLGIDGGFRLENNLLLTTLTGRRELLTGARTGLSLIDTTASHLATAMMAARRAGEAVLAAVGALVAGWVAVRRALISTTEMAWAVARTQTETYRRNGVRRQVFRTRGDERVCTQCEPLEGVIVPVNAVPPTMQIPLHSGCRCMWEPDLAGWSVPAQIWRGA